MNAILAIIVLALAMTACSRNQNVSAEAPKPTSTSSTAETQAAPAQTHFDGHSALQFTKEVVDFGPRYSGTPGYTKLQAYLRDKLKGDHLEEDSFTAKTPAGVKRMTNFIAKFPGSQPGIIVVAGHYDTKPIKNFVGANDGGSSTGLPLELAKELRARMSGGKLPGFSVWVVWLDGEESMQESNDMDFNNSMFGSQHLAAKWNKDGTAKQIKAFLLVDMIGDADLDILRDTNSTPWLQDVVLNAATRLGVQSHFFGITTPMEDDHLPFAKIGVPVVDLIDFTYGPAAAGTGGPYWHTPADTMDKLSADSLRIVGDVLLETIQMLNSAGSAKT